MKMSARLGALGLGIALAAVPAAAADDDLPTIAVAQSGAATRSPTSAPNCLLPGQLRKFGGVTILTPRRAITLDAADCAARGGQPIESTTAAVVE